MAIIEMHPDQHSETMNEAEWRTRVDLAAFYRLAALHGWDDLIFTHISARVPGPEEHFLINPFGLMFEEITASSLVKVDLAGTVISDDDGYGINYAGYVIHSAIHEARPDVAFIAHFHSPDGMAVSAQKEGLLPLNQRSLGIVSRLAYHDYEGVAVNLEEQERIVHDLGDRPMMLLRNHGTLAVGASAGEAWTNIQQLETACTAQVRTLSAGRDNVLMAPDAVQENIRQQMAGAAPRRSLGNKRSVFDLVWDASLRKAQRQSPGFDS